MEYFLAICVAIGLAAACGFRVFVPVLILGVASRLGWYDLSADFSWISSWPAIAAFSAAALLEVGGYYVPWLDNMLDTVATPAAVIAGITVAAAALSFGEMNPMLKWSAAIVAGATPAGVVKGAAVAARAGSSTVTAGFGNFLVATFELIASIVLAALAIVVPVVAAVCVVIIVFLLVRLVIRVRRGLRNQKRAQAEAASAPDGQ